MKSEEIYSEQLRAMSNGDHIYDVAVDHIRDSIGPNDNLANTRIFVELWYHAP